MGSRAIILASLMAMRCSQPAPTEADAGEEVSLPHPDGCTVGVCSLNDVGEPCGACDDLRTTRTPPARSRGRRTRHRP